MNNLMYRLVISGWDDVTLLFNADEFTQATVLLKEIKEHIVNSENRNKKVYLEAVTSEELQEEENKRRERQEKAKEGETA